MRLAGRQPLLRRHVRVSTTDVGWLVLDAKRLLFASPMDLAGVVALAHTATAARTDVTFVPPDDVNVAAYLQRMDVFQRLPGGTEIKGLLPAEERTDRSQVLLEVSPMTLATVEDHVNRLGLMLAPKFTDAVAGLVFQGVGELIDNAVSHGASRVGAFLAAQSYTGKTSGRSGFEFAVCDTGIGILNHLRRNPNYAHIKDAQAALAYAIQPGVTGTDEPRGYGLADLLHVTRRGGVGRLVLRSGDGIASVAVRPQGRRKVFASAAPPITGTWAWLRVRFP